MTPTLPCCRRSSSTLRAYLKFTPLPSPNAMMVALGCTRCANCERGRGCPFGLTTTDPELSLLVESTWGTERLDNFYRSLQRQLREILRRLGLGSIRDLVGRTDTLLYRRRPGAVQ